MNIESPVHRQAPLALPPAPWRGGSKGCAPRFELVHSMPVNGAVHCISVCLFSDPEWQKRFPHRKFDERFLAKAKAARERLQALNYAVVIFTDKAMESTAINLGIGSVYRVTTPPAFPFAQHQWRYLAALLPVHETIRAYHFRGMDNLEPSETDVQMFDLLISQQLDVLHEPYLRHRGRHYTPVRGSMSVAREGIASLAWWLQHQRHKAPAGDWVDAWHSDESYLEAWFTASIKHLRPLTVIDRELPMDFYFDLWKRNQSGHPFVVARRQHKPC